MGVLLLPALGAVTVYLLIIAFFGGNSAEKKVRKRIRGLINDNSIEQIHDAVMREKRQIAKDKKNNKLISKKFEEDLMASGIKLNAREYPYCLDQRHHNSGIAAGAARQELNHDIGRRHCRVYHPAISRKPR